MSVLVLCRLCSFLLLFLCSDILLKNQEVMEFENLTLYIYLYAFELIWHLVYKLKLNYP